MFKLVLFAQMSDYYEDSPAKKQGGGGESKSVIGGVVLVLLLIGGGVAAAVVIAGCDAGTTRTNGTECVKAGKMKFVSNLISN